jgi:regulator of sigma E protease
MLLTALAYIAALVILIAIHEYGHYRVAVACGVRVERFSIGFGKSLFKWKPKKQHPGQDTEFVFAAIPLGGYVKMLGQGGDPVSPELRSVAFDHKPLASRAAIVAAGPVANLLLAILLYACVNWIGAQEPKAILASPGLTSMAAQAGVRGGEEVISAGFSDDAAQDVRSMEDVRWLVTQGALDGKDVSLQLRDTPQSSPRSVLLPLSRMDVREADAQMIRNIGIGMPWMPPLINEVVQGDAADKAGLKKGDTVLSVGPKAVSDTFQLFDAIRTSVDGDKPLLQVWRIQRNGEILNLDVTPRVELVDKIWVAKVGVKLDNQAEMVRVRYGPLEGLWQGVVKTWQVSALSLRMMGKMIVGQVSLKNLSGPFATAEVTGKAARMGITQYLLVLAFISVSLGVLNLLPIPVLDGGHLMYYAWEGIFGKPVSELWLGRMQRIGLAVLLAMMSVAFFNDGNRYLGGFIKAVF